MRIAIVYESLFGNTREIAQAIEAGVRQAHPLAQVACTSVIDALPEQVAATELLFVGGPTHFLGMMSARTRRMWVREQDVAVGRSRSGHVLEPGAAGLTLREWLKLLGPAPSGGRAVAFDTRMDKFAAGGAAPRIARRLRRLGYVIPAKPTGFVVEGMEGSLRAGEPERAAAWAADVLRRT